MKYLQALISIVGFCLFVFIEKGIAQVGTCGDCHGDQKASFEASVHFKNSVWCVDCHGGDATISDLESMDKEKGFKGTPSRKDIPQLCAGCHSDKEKMKQYGIPTDQYEQYLTSKHGKRLNEGDTAVAVCTDCHNSHNILSIKDPLSPVFIKNVPATCGRCHSDNALMKKYNISSAVVDEYKQGVHGKALLEKGDLGAPHCAKCHSPHGATPPGMTAVANVCGQCHIYEKQYFRESIHRPAMDANKMKECVSCHSNHLVGRTSLQSYNDVCVKCHKETSEEYTRGQQLKDILLRTDTDFESASKLLKEAALEGLDIAEYEAKLVEAKSSIKQAGPIQHTLSLEKVGYVCLKAKAIADEVKGYALKYFDELKFRRLCLAIFLLFMFAIITLLIIKRTMLYMQWRASQTKANP